MRGLQYFAPLKKLEPLLKDLESLSWQAPRFGAQLVDRLLKDRKDARVLDAAGGTGLGGIEVSV